MTATSSQVILRKHPWEGKAATCTAERREDSGGHHKVSIWFPGPEGESPLLQDYGYHPHVKRSTLRMGSSHHTGALIVRRRHPQTRLSSACAKRGDGYDHGGNGQDFQKGKENEERDLGVHVYGFIANVAHSLLSALPKSLVVKADVIKAAHLCGEAALRLVKAWKPGMQVSSVKAACYRWREVTIIQNPNETSRRRTMNKQRAFEDEKKARMGVVECAKHELLQPFNVLYEKEGEHVAQFKFTVLLMPNGPMRITSGPFDPDVYKSELEVQDTELKGLLQSSASRKTQKKKKKKASKTAEQATAEDNEGTDSIQVDIDCFYDTFSSDFQPHFLVGAIQITE
ncbi:unnamed protein product, partial [Ranitomeya imitator]